MVRATSSRRVPAAERRALIEAAAARLFARHGFATTTVEEIVQAAGVTKPMLYRHYESKQELCIALLERARAELIAAPLGRYTPGAGEVRAQLSAMLDAWLGYVEEHPDATRLLFTPISGDAEVERAQRALHARQRATQVALLNELVPGLDARVAEPLGEALRTALGAIALWWLDHPGTERAVPLRALVELAEGTIENLRRSEGGQRT